MVERYYHLFTHVDVLKSREPEYFICEKPIVMDFDDLVGKRYAKNNKEAEKVGMLEMLENDNEQMTEIQANGRLSTSSTAQTKSFVSILEEGCKKYYDGSAPIFTPGLSEMPNSFAVRCELYGVHTVGYGRTKKIAKQMAAKDMLKKMIEKESFSDFGLGKTKEEALASLENLTVDFQNRGCGDESIMENWVGKVNERCQKLKLMNVAYEIDEEGPPNQRTFIALCKIGEVQVMAHGKTKKIAKTLAAQKMYAELENWKQLADDVENEALAAADGSQEATNTDESTTHVNSTVSTTDTILYPESLQKVRAALEDDFGSKGFTEKLTALINSGDENISKIFSSQELKFTFLEPDLDVNGPNRTPNAFFGFGATETDAKDHAARNALVHLELFIQSSEPGQSSSDHSESQAMSNSSTQPKSSPEDDDQNHSPEKQQE